MAIRPFMAPATSTPATLRTNTNVGLTNYVTITTNQVVGPLIVPRAYSGANEISFDFTPSASPGISITVDGTPANNFHVTYNTATTTATLLSAALNTDTNFSAAGLIATITLGVPDAAIVVPAPEQAKRFLAGATDAETHIIQAATWVTFFGTPGNVLVDGDVVCIAYDELVMPLYGGRRQSITVAPELSSDIPAGSLFIARLYPEKIPGSIPVCTVANTRLIFINGRAFTTGETSPLVLTGGYYQGSSPNQWADTTTIPGVISFESAIDQIVLVLGTKVGATPGAKKVGFTPSGNIASDNVKDAIEELDAEKAGLTLNNFYSGLNLFGNGLKVTVGDLEVVTGNAVVTAGDVNVVAGDVNVTGTGAKVKFRATANVTSPAANALTTNLGATANVQSYADAGQTTTTVALANTTTQLITSVGPTAASIGTPQAIPLELSTNGITRWKVGAAGELAALGAGAYVQNVTDPLLTQDGSTKNYTDNMFPANLVINGNMELWQRGTNSGPIAGVISTPIRAYLADRWYWYHYNSPTAAASVVTIAPTARADVGSAFHYERTDVGSVRSTAQRGFAQEIDRRWLDLMRGKKVTVSFFARCGAGFSGTFDATLVRGNHPTNNYEYSTQVGGYTGGAAMGTTSLNVGGSPIGIGWAAFRLTSTIAVPTDTSNFAIQFNHNPGGGATVANDWYEVTAVQMNTGERVPDMFRYAGGSLTGEILLAQGFYEKSYDIDVDPGTATVDGRHHTIVLAGSVLGGDHFFLGSHPRFITTKVKSPVAIKLYKDATEGQWMISGPGATNVFAYAPSRQGFLVGASSAEVPTLGEAHGHWTADAEI
jgi:hypothetical protein